MRHLPAPVVGMLRAVVPRKRVETVLSDLEADYILRCQRAGSTWWLLRETTSLLISYALAQVRRATDLLPLCIRDLQLVLRGFRRGYVAALASAALLAVGLAAMLLSTALANALLFRPVSATHPDTLRRIAARDRDGRLYTRFAYIELQAIREHMRGAGDVAAVYLQPVALRASGTDLQTMVEVVDGPYFALTGTTTILGRGLMSFDDRPGAPSVAVIAEPLWRRQFNASPAVLGMVVRLNGARYTIVGVAAVTGSSTFIGAGVDGWVPLAHAEPLLNAGWRTSATDRWFTPFALPRTSDAEVVGRLDAASRDLARMMPDPWRERTLAPLPATAMVGAQRSAAGMLAAVLFGLSLLILAAAVSNVGGVLLARAMSSTRTTAIHLSIGAGRLAIARRHLIEGALVGITAGVLALVIYAWGRVRLAEIALLPTLAFRLDLPFTAATVASALGAGAAAGVLLAAGPALWMTRLDMFDALRTGDSRAHTSARVSIARRFLVSAQVCLSLVLVAGATLFVRSLAALERVDVGFAREGLVAMDFDAEPAGIDGESKAAMARAVLARVGGLPGITGVAMSNRAPIDQSTPTVSVVPAGGGSPDLTDVTVCFATEHYFSTVGLPLAAGRTFTSHEAATSADVVIVNEALAARLWPSGDALDRALYLPGEQNTLRVVGIARDSKYRTLTEEGRPHLYRPTPPALGLSLLARTTSDPREALRRIQRTLDAIEPGIVGFFPRTMDDHLAVQLLPTRAAAGAATSLATFAVVLSGTALYALVAWFVALRCREIGLRVALGATPAAVRRLVVGQAVMTAFPGIIAGTVLAVGFGVVARSALYGVSPADPVALGLAGTLLMLIVVCAGYLPSRQATRVDPAASLRQ